LRWSGHVCRLVAERRSGTGSFLGGGMTSVAKKLQERVKLGALRSLGGLRSLVIGPHGVAILARTENGLLLTPSGDFMVGRRLCFNGRYDPELLEFLLGKCEDTSQVLIVGAHVGALVVPLAQRVRRVAAVEANPTIRELLSMNVALNGLQNVEIHGFAAGDRNSEVDFLAGHLNSGASGVAIGDWNQWAYIFDKPEKITVEMKRLDDVFSGDRFDLIVMDVEGAEILALQGMSNLLARCQGLLIEVFESHLRDVAKVSNEEFLSRLGPFFDEATILPEKPRRGQPATIGPYAKDAFQEMMQECCRLGMSNVMFSRRQA
jgi:FkbM family methyltransferase